MGVELNSVQDVTQAMMIMQAYLQKKPLKLPDANLDEKALSIATLREDHAHLFQAYPALKWHWEAGIRLLLDRLTKGFVNSENPVIESSKWQEYVKRFGEAKASRNLQELKSALHVVQHLKGGGEIPPYLSSARTMTQAYLMLKAWDGIKKVALQVPSGEFLERGAKICYVAEDKKAGRRKLCHMPNLPSSFDISQIFPDHMKSAIVFLKEGSPHLSNIVTQFTSGVLKIFTHDNYVKDNDLTTISKDELNLFIKRKNEDLKKHPFWKSSGDKIAENIFSGLRALGWLREFLIKNRGLTAKPSSHFEKLSDYSFTTPSGYKRLELSQHSSIYKELLNSQIQAFTVAENENIYPIFEEAKIFFKQMRDGINVIYRLPFDNDSTFWNGRGGIDFSFYVDTRNGANVSTNRILYRYRYNFLGNAVFERSLDILRQRPIQIASDHMRVFYRSVIKAISPSSLKPRRSTVGLILKTILFIILGILILVDKGEKKKSDYAFA